MMQTADELERRFREATADFHGMQIRWERVLWRVRWRLVALVAGAALAIATLTVVLSGSLLAGKHAVDPSFRSLFANHSAKLSVAFGEPATARGRTRLAHYLTSQGKPVDGLSREQRDELGFTFRLDAVLVGYGGTRLLAKWTVVDAGSEREVPLAVPMAALAVSPRMSRDRIALQLWVPYPQHEGRYVVRFQLIEAASGSPVVQGSSASFVAYPPSRYSDYRTPTYRAKIPRGWPVYADYVPTNGRYVTRAKGPDGLTLVLDTTPKYRHAPGSGAIGLEKSFQQLSGYKRLALRRSTVLSGESFEWRYRLGDVWAVDVFTVREGHGYAVLAEGPKTRFDTARRVARAVAGSISPAD